MVALVQIYTEVKELEITLSMADHIIFIPNDEGLCDRFPCFGGGGGGGAAWLALFFGGFPGGGGGGMS